MCIFQQFGQGQCIVQVQVEVLCIQWMDGLCGIVEQYCMFFGQCVCQYLDEWICIVWVGFEQLVCVLVDCVLQVLQLSCIVQCYYCIGLVVCNIVYGVEVVIVMWQQGGWVGIGEVFLGGVVWCMLVVYVGYEQGLLEIMVVDFNVQCVVYVIGCVIGFYYQLGQQYVFVGFVGYLYLVVVVDYFVQVQEVYWLVVLQSWQFLQVCFQCLVEVLCYYYLVELWLVVVGSFQLYVVEVVGVVDVDVVDWVWCYCQFLYDF